MRGSDRLMVPRRISEEQQDGSASGVTCLEHHPPDLRLKVDDPGLGLDRQTVGPR